MLLVTGPVTTRMREPLLVAYAAMPEPRRVAALGDCALGCNVLGTAESSPGPLEDVPAGRPPHPRLPAHARTQIAEALLALIDRGQAPRASGSSTGAAGEPDRHE